MIIIYKVVVIILPLFCGLAFSLKVVNDQSSRTTLGKIADQIIGYGFSEMLYKKVRLPVLGSLFFLLIGGVGLTRAIIYSASERAIFEMLFPFSFGIGIALPRIIQKFCKNKSLDS